jgi:Flp pilus assembly protein TadG
MTAIRSLIRLSLARRFAADRGAVAATELAIILPVMLVLYIGGIEVGQLITVDRKTALASRTAADLVSRMSNCKSSTAPSDVEGVFKATDAVIAPYSTSPLSVVVTFLAVDKNGTATVMWSRAQRGTPRIAGASFAAPTGLGDGTSTTYWVLGEAAYAYTPVIGYVLSGTFNLSERVYMNWRL